MIPTLYGRKKFFFLFLQEVALLCFNNLGPGTILLAIASALLIVFSTLTIPESYTISVLPAVFYILVFYRSS
jgi:hypothetical protein